MPLVSASPLGSRLATVFDFLPALARRHLAARLGCRATLHVVEAAGGVFTLASRAVRGADVVETRFAQLRSTGRDTYQLYWKNCCGRWTTYPALPSCSPASSTICEPFTGSIDECLAEIARDPAGCYWS